MNRHQQKGTRVSHAHSSARKPLLRRTGLAGLVHSGAFGGSGATSLRRLGLAVVVAAALLALTASPALAARGHVETTQTIGEPCTVELCGPGELSEPSAVAVNEASGDVYVLDQGNRRVERFSSAGVLLGEFNGSGTLADEGGVPAGGEGNPGEIETGQFEFPAAPQTGALAVDNSCALHEPPLTEVTTPKCSEFDPSNGDVYVADTAASHRVVDKFSANGEYLGQITEGNGISFQVEGLEGLAVDPEGTVWIYPETPAARGFTNGNPNVFTTRIPLDALGGFGVSGFAVDPSGNFYGKVMVNSLPQIFKWDHTGKVLNESVDGEGSDAVSIEQTSGAAFLDTATSLTSFSPEGTELERFDFGGALTKAAGIGVDADAGFVYLADSAANQIRVLAPRPPGPPGIEAGSSASEVTSESALIAGEVNPRSEPSEGETTYFFKYGPCPSLVSCSSSPLPFVTPSAKLPPDFEAHPVAANLTGLEPATAYHFLIVASNDHGENEGGEAAFTTQSGNPFALPDARQWQLVSPAQKLGARIEPISEGGVVQAAADGGGITYLESSPSEAEPVGYTNLEQSLSTRTPSGWSSRDLAPPHVNATGFGIGIGPEYKFFNPQLTLSAVQPFGEFNPALSSEASESTAFLHGLTLACATSCYQPLVTGKPGFANVPEDIVFGEEERCEVHPSGESSGVACGPTFRDATEDLSHVILSANATLVPGGPTTFGLYEWTGGDLLPVSVLPSGEPVGDSHIGLEDQATRRAISRDGQRVTWERARTLYLRVNATAPQSASGACDEAGLACTIQVDQGDGCPGCESGGGRFQIASADGSRVFFTDTKKLTADAGAGPQADLYECHIVEEGLGHLGCQLTDLTPERSGEAAAVQGNVLGASKSGATIYFVADGVLTEVENATHEKARSGHPNLYVLRDGITSYIATLANGDDHDWSGVLAEQPTRVTADGRFLELMSEAVLTSYDNRDLGSGEPTAEVYAYDADSGRLACASCDPSGSRPLAVEYLKLEPGSGGLVGGGRGIWEAAGLVAANVPGWTAIETLPREARYQPRYLNDQGRLFFNTVNALVPADSNGTQDVYEYEPPGVGNCTTASPTFSETNGGCVNLISSGTSSEESAFLDASENGDDVFFLTAAKLAKADTDNQLDVYDAHSCEAAAGCLGEEAVAPEQCSGQACQAPGAAPLEATPESQNFAGPGNPKPARGCPKGKVKRHGKCVKKSQPKKHKKKGKKHHANSKRGAGK